MPYEYKVVEWSKYDDVDVGDVLNQETDSNWNFYESVQIHDGRVDLIFRKQTSP